MRGLLKFLFFLILLGVIVAGGAWFWTGRGSGPAIEIRQPGGYIGQASTLALMVTSPGGQMSRLDASVEQNGKTFPVFMQSDDVLNEKDDAGRWLVMRPIGKRAIPDLQDGKARIVVRAARPALFGLRELESTVTRDVEVRLQPPRVEVLSTFHYVNHGGSEFAVYRATPEDVESGVRVGDKEYRGFPAAGAGIPGDAALRVAFFALLY